jgi:hypothetical protein
MTRQSLLTLCGMLSTLVSLEQAEAKPQQCAVPLESCRLEALAKSIQTEMAQSGNDCQTECRSALDRCVASTPERRWNVCRDDYMSCLESRCKRR